MIRPGISRAGTSRVRLAAVVALALVTTVGSGCSTFTKNDIAADVNGRELSIDDLNEIAADFPKLVNDASVAPDDSSEFGGDAIRNVLTRWVQANSLLAELSGRGLEVDDAARAAAAAQYETTDSATWTSLSAATQSFLVDFVVGRTTLLSDETFVPAATIQSVYDAGVTASGVLCVRIMAFATEAEAIAVKGEVDAGADFGLLANDHPLDPAAAPADGVFLDQQTGSPCLSAADYAVLADPLGNTPIGVSSEPIPLDNFFYLFLQRPFAEVAADASTLIAPLAAESVLSELLTKADVTIDSRYGMWDAESGTVVPTR